MRLTGYCGYLLPYWTWTVRYCLHGKGGLSEALSLIGSPFTAQPATCTQKTLSTALVKWKRPELKRGVALHLNVSPPAHRVPGAQPHTVAHDAVLAEAASRDKLEMRQPDSVAAIVVSIWVCCPDIDGGAGEGTSAAVHGGCGTGSHSWGCTRVHPTQVDEEHHLRRESATWLRCKVPLQCTPSRKLNAEGHGMHTSNLYVESSTLTR